MPEVTIRPAQPDDAPGITACVCEAYIHYIERLGKQPAPMLEKYAEVIRNSQVHVAANGKRIVGVIVLQITDEGFYVDNVAVRPEVKGLGIGRRLLELAESEACRQQFQSLYLATHVLMTENQAMYQRVGYVEFDRRVVNGNPRILFRKAL